MSIELLFILGSVFVGMAAIGVISLVLLESYRLLSRFTCCAWVWTIYLSVLSLIVYMVL